MIVPIVPVIAFGGQDHGERISAERDIYEEVALEGRPAGLGDEHQLAVRSRGRFRLPG